MGQGAKTCARGIGDEISQRFRTEENGPTPKNAQHREVGSPAGSGYAPSSKGVDYAFARAVKLQNADLC